MFNFSISEHIFFKIEKVYVVFNCPLKQEVRVPTLHISRSVKAPLAIRKSGQNKTLPICTRFISVPVCIYLLIVIRNL